MSTYSYTVRDKTGRVVKGSLEGDSRDAVTAKLRQTGYIILSLDENRVASLSNIKIGGPGKVKLQDLTIFTRQFATMINAGLSLTKCLSILGGQTESAALREVIVQVGRDVEAGQSLSDSMAKHPKVFPPIFTNMVRAGEAGGVLDEVLVRVADHFERDGALRAKIKSAMTYPAAMGSLVLIVLIAMMIFVVPVFQSQFEQLGGTLPAPTQLLVSASAFVRGIGGIISVIAIIGMVFGFKAWVATTSGRYLWDAAKLRMPVFGGIVRKMALAKFTRTFGTLVAAGVPILSSLDIVGDTAGNEVVARAVKRIRSAIKEGETIAKPLGESPVFPSMLVQMVAVGEETGALDAMLNKIADFYDEEVSTAVDGLTSLIEPLIMAGMGGSVGFIVIALYMPMFKIISLIQ